MGVRRLFSKESKILQGGGQKHTFWLKNANKHTIFLKKVKKHTFFGRPGGQRPPLAPPFGRPWSLDLQFFLGDVGL